VSTQDLWFASRGTGLVALLLFTGSVVLGALNGGRFGSVRWPRFVIASVHRSVSLVALAFLVVHIATAIIDPYAGIGWLAVIIPGATAYRTFWLALGAISFDLMLAITITSLLRPRINLRLWKGVHWASYACWPVAVIHGLGASPDDTRIGWVLALDAGCVLAVLIAVGWRARVTHPDTEARARGLR
jgi:DMSO/TMAO reductase YedYZ heme-binding membrane subunit